MSDEGVREAGRSRVMVNKQLWEQTHDLIRELEAEKSRLKGLQEMHDRLAEAHSNCLKHNRELEAEITSLQGRIKNTKAFGEATIGMLREENGNLKERVGRLEFELEKLRKKGETK